MNFSMTGQEKKWLLSRGDRRFDYYYKRQT